MSINNINVLKLNISHEPKYSDGGLIVGNFGEILSEVYIDDCSVFYQNEPFYLKIGDELIKSFDNKIKLKNGINIYQDYPIIYNIKTNATVIAVYYTTKNVPDVEYISYN